MFEPQTGLPAPLSSDRGEVFGTSTARRSADPPFRPRPQDDWGAKRTLLAPNPPEAGRPVHRPRLSAGQPPADSARIQATVLSLGPASASCAWLISTYRKARLYVPSGIIHLSSTDEKITDTSCLQDLGLACARFFFKIKLKEKGYLDASKTHLQRLLRVDVACSR